MWKRAGVESGAESVSNCLGVLCQATRCAEISVMSVHLNDMLWGR